MLNTNRKIMKYETILSQIIKKKKKKLFFRRSGSVWYVCLKIENCCLKTFVEIRIDKKMP